MTVFLKTFVTNYEKSVKSQINHSPEQNNSQCKYQQTFFKCLNNNNNVTKFSTLYKNHCQCLLLNMNWAFFHSVAALFFACVCL